MFPPALKNTGASTFPLAFISNIVVALLLERNLNILPLVASVAPKKIGAAASSIANLYAGEVVPIPNFTPSLEPYNVIPLITLPAVDLTEKFNEPLTPLKLLEDAYT